MKVKVDRHRQRMDHLCAVINDINEGRAKLVRAGVNQRTLEAYDRAAFERRSHIESAR